MELQIGRPFLSTGIELVGIGGKKSYIRIVLSNSKKTRSSEFSVQLGSTAATGANREHETNWLVIVERKSTFFELKLSRTYLCNMYASIFYTEKDCLLHHRHERREMSAYKAGPK